MRPLVIPYSVASEAHTPTSFGPVKGAQPDRTTWVNNIPHTAWFDMSQYYITAFKTGTYPAITVS